MYKMTRQLLKSYNLLLLIIILQVIIYFTIYANLSIARLAICLLYLTLIPGIVILKLLKLKNLDLTEKALFSLGLSIAFLMLIGLLVNELGKLAFTNLLSTNLLLLSINTCVLILSLMAARHKDSITSDSLQLKRSEKLFASLLIILLLILGSYGTFIVIISGNSFLILLLILVNAIAILSVFLTEKISSRLYPSVLLIISFSMLFFATGTLIIKYIGGTGDGPIEFYAFKLTEIKGFWDSTVTSSPYAWGLFPTYSMLSVTILPIVFSTVTGADGSLIFRLVYPLLIAFLPIGVYKIYQTQMETKKALLAAFFFFTVSFGKGWGSYKQQIAQLFYILLFLLIFQKNIPSSKKYALFTIFSVGLIISHYALTYIFLFIILFAFTILTIMEHLKRGIFSIYQTKIPLNLLLIFLTITFSWYIFVNSAATFDLLSKEIDTITSNLGQFFNIESRGTALHGLGFVETPTIFHKISSVLFLTTEFLLAIGFLKLLTTKNKNSKFSIEYKVIAAINMAIIVINLLLPRLADTLLMSRFYQTTLIILAPLAILGGETIIKFIPKPKMEKLSIPLLTVMVFVPLFLFQTGFVYEIARVQNYSLVLSMYRIDDLTLYKNIVNAQEVNGALWLSKHIDVTNIFIYSDSISQSSVLTSYGIIERGRVYDLFLLNNIKPALNEFVYLADIDLISKGYLLNVTETPSIFENQEKIYTNGKCEIYKGCNTR